MIKNHNVLSIKLIVLDTLARCFRGIDENAVKDKGVFILGCDILKAKIKVPILLVYHSGEEQGNEVRG